MPSTLVAPVTIITNIRTHPNADRLQICQCNGWQLVCAKDSYEENERVVFIAPDTLISDSLADTLNIKQHLSSVKNQDGSFVSNDKGEQMWRIRQAKLRGEPSFGTTIPKEVVKELTGLDIDSVEVGTNLADELGLMKYEPAMRSSAGDAEVDHPLFIKYTSIENLRNYPNAISEGEEVVASLKIHGTNCRVGVIDGVWMAGSHALRRANPASESEEPEKSWKANTYWFPLSLSPVQHLLSTLSLRHKQVILFGEVYGNIQKGYNYDSPNGIAFRAFDLLIDGKYLDYEDFITTCYRHEVDICPILGTFYYSYEKVVSLAESYPKDPLGDHPMEGLVVKPVVERTDPRLGRVIFKYVTNSYLFDKKKSDYKDF